MSTEQSRAKENEMPHGPCHKTNLEILYEDVKLKRKRPSRFLVVAGEASSDEHASLLIKAILKREPKADIFGMGGSALRSAGADTIVDSEKSASVMGITEIFGSIRKLYKAFYMLLGECERRKPDLAILVDFPDFNLRLARALWKRKIPVFYYISPQLWAWRSGRVKTIRKYVKRVGVIFPFEEDFYRHHGVDARYVGHPFVDRAPISVSKEEFLTSVGLDPQKRTIALLPGSRVPEVSRLVPVMTEAFKILQRRHPDLQALLPVAAGLSGEKIRGFIASEMPEMTLVQGRAREVLNIADAAVVASGTVTVEAALASIPFVVVYRLSGVTYRIARFLVRGIKHFAMANLVAGEKVVEELLQNEVTPERIASELEILLEDSEKRNAMRKKLQEVREKLTVRGEGTAADRAAGFALELLEM